MYETNGLHRGDKYEDVEAIGVGIATKDFGFYVEFRYLNESEFTQMKALYKEFLDKHHSTCWVFNIDFEMVITRKLLGPWAIYDFKDADIFRIIMGDQIGYSKKMILDRRARGNSPQMKEIKVNRDQRWSLKYTAQKYLNVESWDNEFEWLESKFWVIFNGFQHDNIQDFLQNPIVGNLFHQWVEEGHFTESEMTKILRGLCEWKKVTTSSKLRDLFPEDKASLADELKVVMFGCKTRKAVKSHPYFTEVLKRYPEHEKEFEKLLLNKKYFGNPFAIQPSEVVGKYCIQDSYYTIMIAEDYYEKDEFNHDPKNPDKVPAKWMTSQKMVDIFAGNKAIGAKLHMYGVSKSNKRRDKYSDIQWKARVHSNYVVALAYYQMLLSDKELVKHPMEEILHPIFKSVISKGGNPTDFGRVTKLLFPLIYDPSCEYGWSEDKANELLGDKSTEIKDVLLDHKPKGFENASAHSRALNLHKETATLISEYWNEQDLPDVFNWLDVKKYYTDLSKLESAKSKLRELGTCSIRGMHIDEVIKLDTISLNGLEYGFKEIEKVLKKEYYDLNANNEMVLGAMTERWKNYKTLLFLYHPAEYKGIIDNLNLWDLDDSIDKKVSSFKSYMDNIIGVYKKNNFISDSNEQQWEVARRFARDNNYPENLCNPIEADMGDNLQVQAYLDNMLSHDLMLKHGVSFNLMNQYVWYQTLSEDDIMLRKGWLMDKIMSL
jgi:hypothetical protein